MTRQEFYLGLALELNKLGVPPELINTHIDQFKAYLDTLSEDEADRQIAGFGDVRTLAGNIYRLLCGTPDAPVPASEPEDEGVYSAFRVEEEEDDEMPSEDEITTDYAAIAREYGEPVYVPDTAYAQPETAPDEIEFDESEYEQVPFVSDESYEGCDADFETSSDTFTAYDSYPRPEQEEQGEGKEDYVYPDTDAFESESEEDPELEALVRELPEILRTTEDELVPRDRHVGVLTQNNTPLFWILFVVTLPITLPLFVISMALFGFAYLILGILDLAAFAGIFASAIGGAVLALTGGLYGVSCLRSGALAVGLFELGLALVIVGLTVLCSYLCSILALRAIPALFKLLTRFLCFFLDKLLLLIEKIKKECARK